ncbi:FG-GAP-like repeat-containing protein [Streptomyces albiaxialis]|uniref:FG-GAP-like repeat-containing protein n=1 Tax=Streptomyces albiaxialis TaxID=329523 RepID=A0ABP5HDA2_9ACTN
MQDPRDARDPDPRDPRDPREVTEPSPGGAASRRRLGLVAVALAVVVIAAVPLLWSSVGGDGAGSGPERRPGALTGPAGTAPAADFDNDGAQDVHTTGETGVDAVFVAYGAREKDERRRVRLDLDSPGVPGEEGKGVSFGERTAARDFDGDSYTDLAASVEGEGGKGGLPEDADGGLVVLWGSPKGLTSGAFIEDMPDDYLHTPLGHDPLVAGDMDGDGHSDLVVRVGSEHGLVKGPFRRDGSIGGTAEVPSPFPGTDSDDDIVTSFAADLDGDGSDDLVTSHTTEDDGMGNGKVRTGWMPGGADGLGAPETGLLPGIETATTGDVDKDGYTDVVLRRYPKGSSPDSAASGPVEVFPGSDKGPDPSRRTELDQDSPGVPGHKEEHSQFGSALDAGDADGDGYADIAAAAPAREAEKGKDDKSTNAVTVLHGGPEGLTGKGADTVGEPASSEKEGRENDETTTGTRFGSAFRLGDTDGDGHADLTVGAPRTGGFDGALWTFPARGGGWPQDLARVHRPRDFGDAGKAADDETLGAQVR